MKKSKIIVALLLLFFGQYDLMSQNYQDSHVHDLIAEDDVLAKDGIQGGYLMQSNEDKNGKAHQHILIEHQGNKALILVGSAPDGLGFSMTKTDATIHTASYDRVMTLLPNGNVGIGAKAPQKVLHTYSTDLFTGRFESATDQSVLELITNQGVKNRVEFVNRKGKASIFMGSKNRDVFTILQNGNVGMGTEQPSSSLHVHSDDVLGGLFETPADQVILELKANGKIAQFVNRNGNAGIWLGGALNDVLKATLNGQVGINLDMEINPRFTLDVKGTTYSDNLLIGSTKRIDGTVAIFNGAVLIADDEDNEPPMQFNNAEYGKEFLLWVEEGIVTDDVAIAKPDEWSDHVFEEDYELMDLEKLEAFIQSNHHLPNIPSEAEVLKNGYTLNQMNAKLLEKIEELTLHIIEQKKEIDQLRKLEKRIEKLEGN
ncbi:MAG: hypothetical protein DHS20C18_41320 [Saprospiraceae bacterium]|nr:MAG: hypothetical protein DHS20C18_41320 [Saprospiraceae bacterium]